MTVLPAAGGPVKHAKPEEADLAVKNLRKSEAESMVLAFAVKSIRKIQIVSSSFDEKGIDYWYC